jgi:hypothetical protein
MRNETGSAPRALALGLLILAASARAEKDLSGLTFSAVASSATDVRLTLADSKGKRLGPAGVEVGETPATAGRCVLTAAAADAAPFELRVHAAHTDGTLMNFTLRSFLARGSARRYDVDFDPKPGGALSVVKAVDFGTLAQDLETASRFGRLGGKKFAAELAGMLARGRRARAREAAAALREFVAALNRAAKENSRADAENGRFADVDAVLSLTADAKALSGRLQAAAATGPRAASGTPRP